MEKETLLNITQVFSILQLFFINDTTPVDIISVVSCCFWLNFEHFLVFNVRSQLYNY